MADPIVVGNLTVTHQGLDSALPCYTLLPSPRECLIYALIGKIRVYANDAFLGTIGGRAAVTEPLAHVVRFPAGVAQTVSLVLDGFSADCLIATCDAPVNTATTLPYLQWNDAFAHAVGSGTHQRTVVEVPTPPAFTISCGETMNIPGGTSSWPAHASAEDVHLYTQGKTTWEECFYVVCPAPATARLSGYYPGGVYVSKTITLSNGALVPMPLGEHPVTAAMDAWCYYAWFYIGDALRKEYRKFASDILTYRK